MIKPLSYSKKIKKYGVFSNPFLSGLCFCFTTTLIFLTFSILLLSPRSNAFESQESVNIISDSLIKNDFLHSAHDVYKKLKNKFDEQKITLPTVCASKYASSNDCYYDIPLSEEQQDTVFSYCSYYDVPCELVFAVMKVESNFNASEISQTDDFGIMQINSVNHEWLKRELGVNDLLDFSQNVKAGTFLLSEYYHKYPDVNKIVMCYRYGEHRAIEYWENGTTETQYTEAIICAIASIKKK